MKITNQTIKSAVLVEAALATVGTWVAWEKVKVHISKHQAFRALRFLQENNLVQSRIVGEGSERHKEYKAPCRAGYKSMNAGSL